jgi:hypothetical protein
MKYIFSSFIFALSIASSAYSQKLTLKGFVNVSEGQTVLFGADTSGTGNKLIWYGNKGAFRAGNVNIFSLSPGDQSDRKNVGFYSFAAGTNTQASGDNSTALGNACFARGRNATAIGYYNSANGENSTAIGTSVMASGQFSTAMGYSASTEGYIGSFVIGDASRYSPDLTVRSTNHNQFTTRFSGGYQLWTTLASTGFPAIGVELKPNANAWSTISDSTRKENFLAADGVDFLKKISQMRIGSWNYKGQAPQKFRHYGPMAQDFFAAFGRDSLGTIGEEKSINQADFDGVNLIAIKALITENEQLKSELERLKEQSKLRDSRLEKVEAKLNLILETGTMSINP